MKSVLSILLATIFSIPASVMAIKIAIFAFCTLYPVVTMYALLTWDFKPLKQVHVAIYILTVNLLKAVWFRSENE